MENKVKYVASWSGGKDSTATIILAHEKNLPLDEIIFSEVMFDNNISGELPEHIEFVYSCKRIFENWGYKCSILHSDKTYIDCFNNVFFRSSKPERNGKMYGFPMSGHCIINRECKIPPIKKWNKENPDFIHYVGIAIDEPKRLERLKPNCISLLVKFGMTEFDAFELCKKYDLLSPIYKYSKRGGCWFCPNARKAELKHLRDYYPNLWQKLLSLEDVAFYNAVGNIWNTLTKTRIHDIDDMLKWEDAQMNIFDFINY